MFRSLMNDWVFGQNNTGLIITTQLANEIVINSTSHVDKRTEFCFLVWNVLI